MLQPPTHSPFTPERPPRSAAARSDHGGAQTSTRGPVPGPGPAARGVGHLRSCAVSAVGVGNVPLSVSLNFKGPCQLNLWKALGLESASRWARAAP